MNVLRQLRFRALEWSGGFLAGVLMLAAAGCGFHPVASTGKLPSAMQMTYVASGEPYGHLENKLRQAIVARGGKVTQSRTRASAVLDIMNTRLKSRVIAVNTHGQPLQYVLHYRVEFRLLNARGDELLAPQTLDLQRDFAYNVHIQLGSSRRQAQLLRDMQDAAVRRLMLRLEALRRQGKGQKPAQ